MTDRNQPRLISGCCLAAFAFFALICLVMHFSFAGLMIFLGAVLMTAGMFAETLQILLPCGFAVTALAYTVEFVWYLVQSFQRGFQAFFLLFPILEGLLMIAIFVGLVKITLDTRDAKKWGLGITAAAFAAMLLVVGTAFAGWFKDAGEVNYFVFLERIALIPLGIFFGRMMEGEEPILTIDLKKDSDGENGPEPQGLQPEPERTGTEDAPEEKAEPEDDGGTA